MSAEKQVTPTPEVRRWRPHRRGPLSKPTAVVASGLAGVCLLAAFPPYNWWWMAPVGVALLAVAVHRRSAAGAYMLGLLTGVAFFVPLLSFTGLQVGWWPWLLLAVVQANFVSLMAAAAASIGPLIDRRAWLWPAITGVLWVAQEALRSRVPFGGFPWGRLAFSQADAPTLAFASLGGAPLVTFVVGVSGGLLARGTFVLMLERVPVRSWRAQSAVLAVAAIGVLFCGLVVPRPQADGRPVRVAIVQGNVPRMGLDFNAQRRAVLDNHVDATLRLAEDVRRNARPRPDLVIWPENASDIDPIVNADAAARIDAAVDAIGVPIVVGAVLQGPGSGKVRNASIVWTPEKGPAGTYVKRHPVPFAEYVPLRSLVRRITPLVDRVRADFIAGDNTGVLSAAGMTIGPIICFEVAYDNLVREAVASGAELLVVPTNNATFNYAEATQQLAMVQLRAVEHRRSALMASTVGVSAFVDADGTVRDATMMNTQATIDREIRTSNASAVATRTGAVIESVITGTFLAVVLAAAAWRRALRRNTTIDRPERVPGVR